MVGEWLAAREETFTIRLSSPFSMRSLKKNYEGKMNYLNEIKKHNFSKETWKSLNIVQKGTTFNTFHCQNSGREEFFLRKLYLTIFILSRLI